MFRLPRTLYDAEVTRATLKSTTPSWVRWVDRLVPARFVSPTPSDPVGPSELADARILIVVMMAVFAVGVAWSTIALSLGVGAIATSVMVGCVAALGLPWLFAKFASVEAIAMVMGVLVVPALCWPTLYARELWWVSAYGLPTVVVTAGLVLRLRFALVWLGLSAGFLGVTAFVVVAPSAASRQLDPFALDVLSKAAAPLTLMSLFAVAAAARSLRRLATEELKLQRAASDNALAIAERASRARSAFLATMSHELRTPLNGVLGMADLARELPPETDLTEQLNVIVGSSESLLAILNDALDFAKIDSGRMELSRERFDVCSLVGQVVARYRASASLGKTTLAAEVPESLSAQRVGDPLRLGQVLANLVSNAIKFSPGGDVVVALSAAAGDHVAFEVRDSGIGIEADKLALVFEPFRQADSSTTRKFGGTGLGLSIAAELVAAMGGTLEADSEPGVGSTFRFAVHLAVVDAATPSAQVSQHG